jgi:4-hydroxy-3-methylbut-2-en-1-yl diphosphate reductase
MRVIRADVMGMCFGVRDALKAIGRVAEPELVTIHGQLVHNEVVLDDLAERGFRMVDERDRSATPETPTVLITAHGVSDRERDRLSLAGKHLIDTTCPLVTRVHQAALKLHGEGCHVIVVGVQSHVEVRGIVGDLTRFDVVGSVEEVRTYASRRIGIVSQTTTPEALAVRVREAVAAKNPGAEIRFVDTICHPTKDHQRALERLLDQVGAVVVVGGTNSNNTRALARRCEERGKAVSRVASAEDLDLDWFEGLSCVGLTAGTSTLDATIDAVEAAIRNIPTRVGTLQAVGASMT